MNQHGKQPVAFIGTWARDFPQYLNEAFAACLRLGVIPVVGEQPAAEDPQAIAVALGLADEADLYIGIIGNSYGHMAAGRDKSIGELEFDRAAERGIPRIVFRIREDQRSKDNVETNDDISRLAAFINRVKERQTVTAVLSVDEFRTLLRADLNHLGLRKERIRKGGNIRFGSGDRVKGGGDIDAKGVGVGHRSGGRKKTALRVFVASPRDVHEERSRMPLVVDTLNKTIGQLLNVVVELWRWEVDAPPAAGEPQALVDPELDKADIVLVIFWNRFGTPTLAGPTGTQGEVLRALKRWRQVRRPQVMLYFCQRPARLDTAETEQRLKLLKFRDSISSLVLAADYEGVEDFQLRAYTDLFSTISTLFVRKK